jgi:hypothetical protein
MKILNVFVSVLAVAGIASGLHCGSDGGSEFGDAPPCETVYKGQCGATCKVDEDCGAGLYCSSNFCTADCAPNQACAGGASCSPRGRCGANFDSDGGGSSGGEGGSCVDVNLQASKVIPTVILLVDQSGSMNDPIGGSGSPARWPTLRSALMDPTKGVVKVLENDVRFGLALFTWDGNHPISTCPEITSVAVNLGNYNAINTVYQAAQPIDNTPTGDSLLKVAGLTNTGAVVPGGFAATPTPTGGPKLIVIATDGDPDSCASKGNNDAASQAFTVKAAQYAYAAGIKVFDLAVSQTLNAAKQQEVANAGIGLDPATGKAPVYRADNQQQIIDAFNTIIGGARSCVLQLNGKVNAGDESKGTVTLNGNPLGYNDPNGWKLDSPTTLELVGTACNTLMNTPNPSVVVRFPCGSAVIIK